MSFGLPAELGDQGLSYGGYLKVDQLIDLQDLRSDPPQHDEMLFIIIHQVYELWFKELLHEIDAVIDCLHRDEALNAHRLLRRCIEIERVLVSQVAVLETMTPLDFLHFRDNLMPASGFQSAQFREIEIASGLKETRFLGSYKEGSGEYRRLEVRLGQPSLREAFYDLLRRHRFNLPGGESQANPEARTARARELTKLFLEAEVHYGLFLLAESLIEYDEVFSLWRLRHVKMVERMIGSKIGTGGSEGAGYLKKTVDQVFFPELWEMRTYLSNKNPGA
jgi:tryptophan 2,3-dioxygenase